MPRNCLTVLVFIAVYTGARHYPPTVREIMQALGYDNPARIQELLKPLLVAGYVKTDGKPRTLVITPAGADKVLSQIEPKLEGEGDAA